MSSPRPKTAPSNRATHHYSAKHAQTKENIEILCCCPSCAVPRGWGGAGSDHRCIALINHLPQYRRAGEQEFIGPICGLDLTLDRE
ncbi:unnamed protein product [Dovyalis caffra]|uniref:Recombination activating protein 1 n=1 Tax=Dovyalis caffra TaxID=77055 RepID=A0AAV1RID2_9ROSI|nr:unnamed protein product [Dovyalis caffra]